MRKAGIRSGPHEVPAGWVLPTSTLATNSSRSVTRIEQGTILIAQRLRVRGRASGFDVSGPFWICGLVRLIRGLIRYRCGERLLEPPGRWFGMFMPPYSVVEVDLVHCRALTLGFACTGSMPTGAPSQPNLFRPRTRRLPAGRRDILAMLQGSEHIAPVSREQNADHLARLLKNAIDRSYSAPLSLGVITRKLGLSPSSASRRFSEAYGLPPVRYRHSLRVLEAMLRLAEGHPICEVFQDVGFQDLSRFYSQFRRIACAPPGRYRFAPEKNAKT